MTAVALTAALAAMSGHPHLPAVRSLAIRLAPVILAAAADTGMDPLVIGAVAWRESGYRQTALGKKREVGTMQLAPRGQRVELCPGLDPTRLEHNVLCGARILAAARRRCGNRPSKYLTVYNRPASGCRRSAYSQKVIATLARARWNQEV